MKKTYILLIGALVASTFTMSQVSARQQTAIKRLGSDDSRAAWARVYGTQSQKIQSNPGKDGEEIIPMNDKNPCIRMVEKANTKTKIMEHGGYKFSIVEEEGAKNIASVTKNGKSIIYTKKIHDSLQENMPQDLKEIIQDNMLS